MLVWMFSILSFLASMNKWKRIQWKCRFGMTDSVWLYSKLTEGQKIKNWKEPSQKCWLSTRDEGGTVHIHGFYSPVWKSASLMDRNTFLSKSMFYRACTMAQLANPFLAICQDPIWTLVHIPTALLPIWFSACGLGKQ